MVTLAQLRTFTTVATLNSFSRGAEALHLTQPAVSAQIQALEHKLNTQLFDRNGKHISLSAQGRIVLRAAEEITARLAAMEQELADLLQARIGRLTIGASQAVGSYLLPELLAHFGRDKPGIEVSVCIERARRVFELLADGEVDCALVAEGIPVTDKRIAVRPLLQDELTLVVPAGHYLAQLERVPIEQLAQMTLLLTQRGSASSEHVLEALADAGVRPLMVRELGNISAVKRAVEAELGVSIVSRLAVSQEIRSGRLSSVPLGARDLVRRILLCWHHSRPMSKATEAFVAFLHRRAAAIAKEVADGG